jgi:O-antigen ligase
VIAGAPVAFFLFGIWLTRSRGGLVALAAMAAFAVVEGFGGRAKRLLNVTIWAGLLLFLVLYFRMEMADGSALGRREAWSVGLGMLKESPVWGAGFGAFDDADRVAHNSFVHCFGELGLVGYWLWLTAVLVTLRQLQDLAALEANQGKDAESLARWATALRLSLLSFLVSSLFLSRTYSPTLFILLGLPTALAGIARQRGIRSGPTHFSLFALQTLAFTVGTIPLTYVLVRAMW